MDQRENRFYREAPPADGGPAFPQHGWTKDPEVLARMQANGGMTLRDYFAATVLQSLLDQHRDCDDIEIAKLAYDLADAMLRQRVDPDCPSPYRLLTALGKIAQGANGQLDNDTELANIAKRALNMEVDE